MKRLRGITAGFLGLIIAAAGLLPMASAASAGQADLYDGKIILELTFEDGTVDNFYSYTNGGACELLNVDQELACHITKTGTLDYANQAYLDGFSLIEGCKYRLSFDAWSDASCSVQYRIQINGGDYHAYVSDQAVLTSEKSPYEIEFVMEEKTDPAPRLAFNMGMQEGMAVDPGEHTIYYDNIRLEVIDCSGAVLEEEKEKVRALSVNHVGYRPEDQKTVITTAVFADSPFEVKDEEGNVCFSGVFSGQIYDVATRKSTCRGDFTELQTPGTYQITVSKDGEEGASQTFVVADDVYDELTEAVLEMLRLQRCGMELTEETAGEYAHPACHTGLAQIYGTDEWKEVAGGWHDAGDYGRYIVSGAQTVADLFYIYEQITRDDRLLEEARYELEWMLKMQDQQTGGVYHKVTCANFPGTVMPQEETETLILAPVSAAATGDFAAVMAKASEVFQPQDAEFASACSQAAQSAWHYLQTQDTWEGFTNPADIVTGEYPDTELKDERFWAAVELLDQVQQGNAPEELREELTAAIRDSLAAGMSCGLGWADMGAFALYDLAVMETENAELQAFAQQAGEQILSETEALEVLVEKDGYFVSMGTDYYWGSNMGVANHGMLFLMAEDLTGDAKWHSDAKLQLDYLLGVNGLDFCYVSGFGEKCLSDPHHRPSQAVGKAMPGMLAGGPNRYLEDPYAKQVLSDRAPALCYADNQQSYSTNEVAIYWNSPLLVLLYGIR